MSIDEIRLLKNAEPFSPFEIETKSGEKVFIERPIRIALSRSGKTVAGFGLDGYFSLVISDIARVRKRAKRRRKAA